MEFTLGQIKFDVEALTSVLDPSAKGTPYGEEVSHTQVFFWNCASQEGAFANAVGPNKVLKLENLVGVQEFTADPFNSRVDKRATLMMKLKVLTQVQLRSIKEINEAITGQLGETSVTIDISPFEWLKPHASFAVWADIHYHNFEFSNDAKKLKFYFAMPHAITLRCDVTHLCKASGVAEGLEGGKDVDDKYGGPGTSSKDVGKRLRRIWLRARRRAIRGLIGMEMPAMPWMQDELKRIEKELETLSQE